jgi:beta-glucosidase
MCSYNQINGTSACENDYTLNTVLKGELDFKGFVQSDWGATKTTAKSVNGGLDMTMPGGIFMGVGASYFGKNLTDAVGVKDVSEDRVTDMAMRIVASWYKMRQDENFPNTTLDSFHLDKAPYVNVQADHYKLVREMGVASSVLLKNTQGTLPISPKNVKKIAIIGSDAGPDPKGLNSCDDHACSSGTLAQGWGSGTASFPYMVDPLAGLTEAFGDKVKIQSTLNDWDLEKAASTAEGADYAFVFSNADSGEDYVTVDGNKGDRNNLTLWNNGDNLVNLIII